MEICESNHFVFIIVRYRWRRIIVKPYLLV